MLYNPQQLERRQLGADAQMLVEWYTSGDWERWYAKLYAPPPSGAMAAEEAAWNAACGQAVVAFYYGFIAYLIPLKGDARTATTGGWLCDPGFLGGAFAALAALLMLVAADLYATVPHATRPPVYRRLACYRVAAVLGLLSVFLIIAASMQSEISIEEARRRTIVAVLFVYVFACAMTSLLALLAFLTLFAPIVTPPLRLLHKARDYALSACILAPLAVLAALRLPGRLHRVLVFQQSFVDLDAKGQLLYACVLVLAVVVAALLSHG